MTDARRNRLVGNDRVAAVEKVARAMHETARILAADPEGDLLWDEEDEHERAWWFAIADTAFRASAEIIDP